MAVEAKMRVLHVLAELCPSGAETMLLSAQRVFSERGFSGEILATGTNVGPFAPALAAAGYPIHHIAFAKDPRFFFRVFRLVRGGRYDVVHLHTERASFWLALVALTARSGRVIRSVHNVFAFHGSLRWRRKLQRRMLERLGVVYVTGGANVQQTELAHYGLRTRLVSNWYDSRRFVPPSDSERSQARESLGIDPDETVLISIGNCSKTKNHSGLIEAIARLSADAQPLYLHVGIEGAEEPERQLARQVGISQRIRFLGAVNDLRPLYFASDVFVMPSLHEGRSVAVLEALATGLPALLTDVAGLRDLRDMYPGLCYAEPTAESLAEALASLLEENRQQRRLRAADYPEISQALFGVEAGVEGYVQVYRGH